jgi:hypothetical protein
MTRTFRYMTKGFVSFPQDEVWLKMCASLLRTGLTGPLAVPLVRLSPRTPIAEFPRYLSLPEPGRRPKPGITSSTTGFRQQVESPASVLHAGRSPIACVIAAAKLKPDVVTEVSHEHDVSHICSAPGHILVSGRSASSGRVRAAGCSIGIDIYQCLSRHIDQHRSRYIRIRWCIREYQCERWSDPSGMWAPATMQPRQRSLERKLIAGLSRTGSTRSRNPAWLLSF